MNEHSDASAGFVRSPAAIIGVATVIVTFLGIIVGSWATVWVQLRAEETSRIAAAIETSEKIASLTQRIEDAAAEIKQGHDEDLESRRAIDMKLDRITETQVKLAGDLATIQGELTRTKMDQPQAR